MNKTEYVQIIEKALSGNVSSQELQDTVSYYRDYIDMEMRKGKSEQEVLDHLGNPRLLVKSIIAAKGQKIGEDETESVQENSAKKTGVRIPLFVIVFLVLLVLGMIIKVLLPILIPVLILLGIILFCKKLNK